jgi:hypothetical protein
MDEIPSGEMASGNCACVKQMTVTAQCVTEDGRWRTEENKFGMYIRHVNPCSFTASVYYAVGSYLQLVSQKCFRFDKYSRFVLSGGKRRRGIRRGSCMRA